MNGADTQPEVEVFAAGSERGKTYTPADLDDMVANWNQVSRGQKPGFLVPAVIGHEEPPGEFQRMLEATDTLADGTVSTLRRDGDKLKARFRNVSTKLAEAIRDGRILGVSSEVYDSPPTGLPGKGKMLRRVAFLGAAIPEKKTLAGLPADLGKYAERGSTLRFKRARPGAAGCGTFHCFSEVVPMPDMPPAAPATPPTSPDLMAQLQQLGFDTSVLGDPQATMAEIVRVLSDKAAPPTPDHAAFWDQDPPDAKDDEQKKMYAEKARMYGEKCLAKYGEAVIGQATEGLVKPAKKDDTMPPEKMSEQQVEAIIERLLSGRTKEQVDKLQKYAEQHQKLIDSQLASQKRNDVEAFIRLHSFCEGDPQTKQVRILPRELDPENPANLRSRLMRADAFAVVHKFSEKGKEVALTELDLQKLDIELRMPQKFGERFQQPHATKTAADDELAEVESHYEMYAENFRKAGLSKETFVAGFQEGKKLGMHKTVAEYVKR